MDIDRVIMDLKIEESDGNTSYLTHNFHPYPAKFIPQIPKSIIKTLTKEGEVVLDPFCGCGTTLVEAKLLNREAIGVDINPIATLITRAKTNKLSQDEIQLTTALLASIERDIEDYYNQSITINYKIPDFNNIEHWFQQNVLHELGIIKFHIDNIKNEKLKTYLYTALSAIIVTVSNQESDTRYAAVDKRIKDFRTFSEFSKKVKDMNTRMSEFSKMASDAPVRVYTADTRNMSFLKNDSVDLIVTSPPYANTYDYYLYHKLRMYWLGYDVNIVKDNEIGSRNRHSSKREDISTFQDDLLQCFREMSRVLKNGKYAVIIIGDSVIRGKLIRANELIKEIARETNFIFIKEVSYKLSENSKMFNPKFANKRKLEYIMFFRNNKQ
jgi:site-specific DNA-methyltransferase (cytosine-N4-specific)